MGFSLGGSESSSTTRVDESIDDRSLNQSDIEESVYSPIQSEAESGNLTVGGWGDNSVKLDNSTTANFIDPRGFDLASESLNISDSTVSAMENVSRESLVAFGDFGGDALDFGEDVARRSFDSTDDAVKGALDFGGDTVKGALNFGGESLAAVAKGGKDSLSALAGIVNNAFSFASGAHSASVETVENISAIQSGMFSSSLDSMAQNTATTVSAGNTDIIKYVMIGLAVIVVAFTFIKR